MSNATTEIAGSFELNGGSDKIPAHKITTEGAPETVTHHFEDGSEFTLDVEPPEEWKSGSQDRPIAFRIAQSVCDFTPADGS